jgi:hypothetical protein
MDKSYYESTKTTIWCTNFDIEIVTNGQVTVCQYKDDYLVYQF